MATPPIETRQFVIALVVVLAATVPVIKGCEWVADQVIRWVRGKVQS